MASNNRVALSRNEFYKLLFQAKEWRGLSGKDKTSTEVQSFISRFYNERKQEFNINFTLANIKSRLIITKTQVCSYGDWVREASSAFDLDTTSLNFPASRFVELVAKAFAEILTGYGRKSFSFNELNSIFINKKEQMRGKLNTDKELTGVLDIIAKLVSFDVLIYRGPMRVGGQPTLQNDFARSLPAEPEFHSPATTRHVASGSNVETFDDSIRHVSRKKITIDQHYGRRISEKEGGQGQEDHITNKLKSLTGPGHRTNKNGVTISSDRDDIHELGRINFGVQEAGQESTATVTVHFDTLSDKKLKISACDILGDRESFHIFKYDVISKEIELAGGESYKYRVTYKSNAIGNHSSILMFKFVFGGTSDFVMIRALCGQTFNSVMDLIKPTGSYRKPRPFNIMEEKDSDIIRGIAPENYNDMDVKVPLNHYPIPDDLRRNLNKGKGQLTGYWKDIVEEKLSKENYVDKFHALLHLEELQMEIDIQRYDIRDAIFNKDKRGQLLTLKVSGLAEGRPSLIVGDRLYASEVDRDGNVTKTKYEAFIHEIEGDQIRVKFGKSFNHIEGMKYNVRFAFNRFQMKVQHRALDIVKNLIKTDQFPAMHLSLNERYPPLLSAVEVSKIRVRDRNIENNPEQLQAVKNIVAGTSRPHPYIIFGPPGTGKTVTVVEAIRQVLIMIPESRVLVCAPSNAASDLLLHRLLNPSVLSQEKYFRINAYSRRVPIEFADVKDGEHQGAFHPLLGDARLCCKMEERKYRIPKLNEMMEYRVVVSTNMTAARLVSMGISLGHFTHVFMDESGQAAEPESLISLAGLLSPECKYGGQIVLAGDPKQLSPVLRSPIATSNGLQVPLIERLMKYPRYRKGNWDESESSESESSESSSDSSDESDFFETALEDLELVDTESFDCRYITKLLKHYRSHPDILTVPNELFYDGELAPCADELTVKSLCQWRSLPAKDCPIIFHGVKGTDQREENSPSFFNAEEATKVLEYVKDLLDQKSLAVKPEHIGVVSPYRKQCEKIRKLFSKDKKISSMTDIKVGSVEEFQGQEKRIIIISTVRSNKDHLHLDAKFRLGFLKNPKRFNVSITRARALLIVIGNPFVLSNDFFWNRFLEFCVEKKCYVGCRYKNEADNIEEIVGKLQEMEIDINSPILNCDVAWERRE
eukprot:gene6229-6945_t